MVVCSPLLAMKKWCIKCEIPPYFIAAANWNQATGEGGSLAVWLGHLQQAASNLLGLFICSMFEGSIIIVWLINLSSILPDALSTRPCLPLLARKSLWWGASGLDQRHQVGSVLASTSTTSMTYLQRHLLVCLPCWATGTWWMPFIKILLSIAFTSDHDRFSFMQA